jgi:hypothetical protein
LTDREYLTLHAEVKALQERLGISYKDASHRLYMAEVEKLKVDDGARKMCVVLKARIAEALQAFNEYSLEDVDDQDDITGPGPSATATSRAK